MNFRGVLVEGVIWELMEPFGLNRATVSYPAHRVSAADSLPELLHCPLRGPLTNGASVRQTMQYVNFNADALLSVMFIMRHLKFELRQNPFESMYRYHFGFRVVLANPEPNALP